MASVTALREGLKDRLATIAGVNVHAKPPGVIITPAAFVLRGPIEFDETMGRGADAFEFRIALLLGKPTDSLGEEHIDPYLAGSGSTSVKAAIDGDGTLGGVADWTRVTRVPAHGQVEYAGVEYVGAFFDVEVSADGT